MTATDRPCFICDEGYNGEIPCPQCNTAEWNAYHEEHKQTITVVERSRCSHPRYHVLVEDGRSTFDGWCCSSCRDVIDLVPQATAETVE